MSPIMDSKQLYKTLEGAGFTEYEARTYIALTELGAGSAIDIAEAADVPQARIYDVLRGLAQDGYIEIYQQDTLRARAHDLDPMLEELQRHAENVIDTTEEIRARWKHPTVEDHMVTVVTRFETVLDRARERIIAADNEIEAALTPTHISVLRDALEIAYDNDVLIKIALTPESAHDDPPMTQDKFEGIATEVHYRSLPTPFLILTDRTQVCFAPDHALHPSNEYGVLVDDYSLSRVFDWYFQTAFWEYWDVLYIDRKEDLPHIYTNIRECIREIGPLVNDGFQVTLTVVGIERSNNEESKLTGIVDEFNYADGSNDDGQPLSSFIEPATILLNTDEGICEIGGWGTLFEKFEARKIVVEAVEQKSQNNTISRREKR